MPQGLFKKERNNEGKTEHSGKYGKRYPSFASDDHTAYEEDEEENIPYRGGKPFRSKEPFESDLVQDPTLHSHEGPHWAHATTVYSPPDE